MNAQPEFSDQHSRWVFADFKSDQREAYMKRILRNFFPLAMVTVLSAGVFPLAAVAQVKDGIDRTVLPLAEPARPLYKELDARNVKPPAYFQVKAPAGARGVAVL